MNEESNMRFTTVLVSILAILGLGAGGAGLYYAMESRDAVKRLESHIADVEQRIGAMPEEFQKVNNRIFNLSQSIEGSIGAARAEVASIRDEIVAMKAPPAPPPPPILEAAPEGPSTDSPDAASSGGQYVIKSGDTYGKIAKAQGTTISKLQQANPGVDPAKLKIGQKINLP
jgi:LysM repeat protein